MMSALCGATSPIGRRDCIVHFEPGTNLDQPDRAFYLKGLVPDLIGVQAEFLDYSTADISSRSDRRVAENDNEFVSTDPPDIAAPGQRALDPITQLLQDFIPRQIGRAHVS